MSLGATSHDAPVLREAVDAYTSSLLAGAMPSIVERGELDKRLDFELALDVLGGPLFYRLLITGGPIDERLAEGVVELLMRAFASKRTKGRKR
jgi:hypothetical protein